MFPAAKLTHDCAGFSLLGVLAAAIAISPFNPVRTFDVDINATNTTNTSMLVNANNTTNKSNNNNNNNDNDTNNKSNNYNNNNKKKKKKKEEKKEKKNVRCIGVQITPVHTCIIHLPL